MKRGVLYDAATLGELWPRQKPFGPYPWINAEAFRTDVRATDYFDKAPRATSSAAYP